MKIEKLWENYKFPTCEKCKKDCSGRLNYDNLCSNLNYLKKYAENNYIKNRESFLELKNLIKDKTPTLFSFGCGLGLEYIGATEVFGKDVKYFGIDECDWAIKSTNAYIDFEPKLPKTIKSKTGLFLLNGKQSNLVLCFFNSLFSISNNSNLDKELIQPLKNQDKFYLVCDYTINNNYHLPKEEYDFIQKLMYNLKNYFRFKKIDILDGKGIIIYGVKK